MKAVKLSKCAIVGSVNASGSSCTCCWCVSWRVSAPTISSRCMHEAPREKSPKSSSARSLSHASFCKTCRLWVGFCSISWIRKTKTARIITDCMTRFCCFKYVYRSLSFWRICFTHSLPSSYWCSRIRGEWTIAGSSLIMFMNRVRIVTIFTSPGSESNTEHSLLNFNKLSRVWCNLVFNWTQHKSICN